VLPLLASFLGMAYARSGRLAEASWLLEEGAERGGRILDALRSARHVLDLSHATARPQNLASDYRASHEFQK
jgi:hypothetical protein